MSVVIAVFSLQTVSSPNLIISSGTCQGDAAGTKDPQSATPATTHQNAQESKSKGKNTETKEPEPPSGKKALKESAEEPSLSPEQKKLQALMVLDGVLASAQRIKPVEYSLLVQVEAATLLWPFDRERSLSILQNSFQALQKLQAEQTDNKTRKRLSRKQEKLRNSILRKIARLSPDVLGQLSAKGSSGDKLKEVSPSWTAEAEAVMQVARERINDDPELAVRLAQQGLSLGLVNWDGFLGDLHARDPRLAEQTAVALINWLRDNSPRPSNFQACQYPMYHDSLQLRDYYFQAFASRLRRDIRPDLPTDEIIQNIWIARAAVQRGTGQSPRWGAEFAEIISAFESMLQARGVPVPGPRPMRPVDMSSMLPAEHGDTQDIRTEGQRAGAKSDSRARDQECRKLAINAALRADLQLAEDLMAKIESDEVRRETSVRVYSPLIWKAIGEANWLLAQAYTLKISDPLGRTLALDGIAQRMPHSGDDEQKVKDLYTTAVAYLLREKPSENVARAYLMLAKSLFRRDPDAGLEAIKSAIYVLNKLTEGDQLLGQSEVSLGLQPWVATRLLVDEALDLTELIGPMFRELAKRDAQGAQVVAAGFTDKGLYSLAQLGIAKQLLEEANEKKAAQVGQFLSQ
jgi:hypothetical protein